MRTFTVIFITCVLAFGASAQLQPMRTNVDFGPVKALRFDDGSFLTTANQLSRGYSITNVVEVDSSSNFLRIVGSVLYFCVTNGAGVGSGNVSMSNVWSVLYSDGNTNVVELPLGSPGMVLESSGVTSPPVWKHAGSGFPLTNTVNVGGYGMTNASLVQGSIGQFGSIAAGSVVASSIGAVSETLSGNLVVGGHLYVISNTYFTTVINISTTVVMGTTTSYVNSTVYSTNISYSQTIIVTNRTQNTTNYVTYDYYVNVGGIFDASESDWVEFPHFKDTKTGNLVATGCWDFTGATLLGATAEESDPLWQAGTGAIWLAIGGGSTGSVMKAGDTMTGELKGPDGSSTNAYVTKAQLDEVEGNIPAGEIMDPVVASNTFFIKAGDTVTGPTSNNSLFVDFGYGNVGTGSNIYFLGGISNRVERMSQTRGVGPVGVMFSDNNMIRGSNIYFSAIIGSSGCGIHGAGLYRAIISSSSCFDTNNTTALSPSCTFIGGSSGSKIITSATYGNAIVGAKDSTISGGSNSGILGGEGSTISAGSSGILGGGGHSIAAGGGGASAIVGGGNGYIGSSAQGCSVILGGNYNRIEGGGYNVIGGGQYNIFSGASYNSSIINGSYNACKTGASFSVVGGYKASANHTRCFVWSDNNRGNSPFNNTNSFFETTSTNQFLVHATGGVGINTNAPLAALHVNGVTRSDAYQFPSGAKLQEISGDTNTLYFVTPDGLTTGRIAIAY